MRESQDVENSLAERAAIGSHGQSRRASPFFHQRQGTGILDTISANQNRGIVTAMLAFGAYATVKPPDRGVIEEQGLHHNLEGVDQEIQPLYVRQFVRDDRLQLIFRESSKRRNRQEHDGTKPTDNGRRLEPLTLAVPDGALETDAGFERLAHGEHTAIYQVRCAAALTFEQQEPAGGTQTEDCDSEQPRFDEPGRSVERG